MKQIYKELGKVRPTVEGDWSIDKNYTLLSIVYDEVGNASYISRKDVPVGIQITNKEYWTRFSNTRVNSDSIVLLSKIQDDGLINSYDLQEAIDSFKVEDRRLGTFISFYEKPIGESTDYRWNLYQFNSNNIDDWNNTKYWQSIYYIQNKFLGLFSSEESLKRTRPFPIIGDYAFVGVTLKEAVIYRCNNIGVWTRTNEKAKDYLSINLKGDITISEEGNWVINGVDTGISSKGEDGKTPLLRIKDYKWQVSYDEGVIYKDIPNSPIFVKEDDEDIVGDLQTDGVKLLKFADKEYNASKFSGLGRVYLRKNIVNGKNILTQEMINKPNTIYIIQYDYDLDNKQINIPKNCTLQFEGGSLSNGTLNGNNTTIIANPIFIFNNIIIKNNKLWNVEYAYSEWFGGIQEALDNFARVKLLSKNYIITNTINLHIGNELFGSNATCLIIEKDDMVCINVMTNSFCRNFTVWLKAKNINTPIKNCVVFNIDSGYIEKNILDKRFKDVAFSYSFEYPIRDINISGGGYQLPKNNNIGIKVRCYDGKGYTGAIAKNCIIANSLDFGFYINTGNKIGYNEQNGWYTDGVLDNCKFIYCTTGVYITSENEKEGIDTFNPPEVFEFNNCSYQAYGLDDAEKMNQVFINIQKGYNIKFNRCTVWDWAVNVNLYPNRVPVLINPNYSKSIEFNNSTYFNQKLFRYSEDIKSDLLIINPISIKNYANALIDLNLYIESNTKTAKYDLFNLAQGDYICPINKYKDLFKINGNFNQHATSILHVYKFVGSVLIIIDIFNNYDGNKRYSAIKYCTHLYNVKKEETLYSYDWLATPYQTTDDFPMGNTYIDENDELVIIKSNNRQIYYDGVSQGTKRLGNTAQRPINIKKGYNYFDTDLNKNIQWDGNRWVDLNGNIADSPKKGTTAQRPTRVQIGFTYKDTDLNKWIIWNGEAWENIDGTALG